MAEFWLGDSNGPMGDVGAFMASELRADRADLLGHIRAVADETPAPTVIAIAGAASTGKSALAQDLARQLRALYPSDQIDVLSVAPGASAALQALRHLSQLRSALAPFAAPQTAPINAAPGESVPRFLLVEGRRLFLNQDPWRDLYPLFDLTIRLVLPPDALKTRLAGSADLAADLAEAQLLGSEGRAADLAIAV